MLTSGLKKILASRLYDIGIMVTWADFDHIIVDYDRFDSHSNMLDFLVTNWNKLIIEQEEQKNE